MALILCLIDNSAIAMRCGSDLVSVGDSRTKLLSTCGPPTQSRSWRVKEDSKIYLREEWTYNHGPDNLMDIVILKDGVIVEIQTGGRGW